MSKIFSLSSQAFKFTTDDKDFDWNTSSNEDMNGCKTSETFTCFPNSLLNEVTPLPWIPQATICENQFKLTSQLRARPWEAILLCTFIPIQQQVTKCKDWFLI